MAKLKLTYFYVHGGRGEPARLAMILGGIEFDDHRIDFSELASLRSVLPLKQVPVLEVDGMVITQCNAINRYVAKLAGLYPEDDFQALLCDEILEAHEDITDKLVATFGLQGEAMRSARTSLVEGPITDYLKWAENKLNERGGQYFSDARLTIADLKVFVWVNALCSGHLDHIPVSLVNEVAPKLMTHRQMVASIPTIQSYYAANRE